MGEIWVHLQVKSEWSNSEYLHGKQLPTAMYQVTFLPHSTQMVYHYPSDLDF